MHKNMTDICYVQGASPGSGGSGGRLGWVGSNPHNGSGKPEGSRHPETEGRSPGSSQRDWVETATPTPEPLWLGRPQVLAAGGMGIWLHCVLCVFTEIIHVLIFI